MTRTTSVAWKSAGGLLGWLRAAPVTAQRSLLAASLGWMLDSFDILLYALVLPSVTASLHLTKAFAGLIGRSR